MSSRNVWGSILVAAFLVGCGDDDSSTATTDTQTATSAGTTSGGSTSSDATSTSGTAGTTSGSTSDASTTTASTSTGDGSTSGDETSGSTGSAAPTWDNFGSDFFESYCWECHGAGDAQGRDYSTLAGVMAESATIRCGTGPASDPPSGCEAEPPAEQFPVGNTLPTEAERITLVEWIDAGTP